MKFVILTGMSGAGKSTAIKMMEDIGFYCVDNLPIPLLEKFVELTTLQSAELQKVAVGIDIRSGQSYYADTENRDVMVSVVPYSWMSSKDMAESKRGAGISEVVDEGKVRTRCSRNLPG